MLCKKVIHPKRLFLETTLHPLLTQPWRAGWGAKSPMPVYNMIPTVNFVFILCESVLYALKFMKVKKRKPIVR